MARADDDLHAFREQGCHLTTLLRSGTGVMPPMTS